VAAHIALRNVYYIINVNVIFFQHWSKQQFIAITKTSPSEESTTDDGYLHTTTKDTPELFPTRVSVEVDDGPMKMMINSGGTTDFMDESTF